VRAAGADDARSGWETVRAEDRALVAGCLQGDEAAWTALWTRYGPLVKTVALRAGCTGEEARDVVQRVGLAAVEGLGSLRDPAKIAGWLAATARYQALGILRQRQPFAELDAGERGVAPAIGERPAEEQLIREERLALLWQALSGLDPRCQRLIRRLDLDDPTASYQEVAADEGLASSSIGPIRGRCLRRLRTLFTKLSRSAGQSHCSG